MTSRAMPSANGVFGALSPSLSHLTYWIAGVTILAMGVALYLAARQMQEAITVLDRNIGKAERLAVVAAEVNRAEAAQRGFLLYGEESFLTRRDEAIARMRAEANALLELVRPDAAQHERIARLSRLIDARARQMLETEAKRREDPFAVGGQVAQEQGARIQRLVTEIRSEQQARLSAHRAATRATNERTLLAVFAAMGVVLIVLVPAYFMFIREARGRRRAEGFVSSLADAVPGALVRYRLLPDGSSRYEFVSEGALRLRGFPREEAMRDPQTVLATIHDDDRPAFMEALREGARNGTLVQHDYRVRGPGGDERWIRTSAAPQRERDGSAVFSAYWSDVTEQKRLESALREAKDEADAANRAKSAFLATMSHEIRTPMNGVLGMLELLALTELNEEQRGTLSVIRESGRSLMRIIDDILDLSKIEAGKLELRPEPSDVAELAERVRNVHAGNASSKGLILRHLTDGRIGRALLVDPLRLLQILNNLVSNAIKFTEQGEVTLWTGLAERRPGVEMVRFSVSDTGPGISEAGRARLFAPFSQVSSNPAAKGGTGLGLSICQRLAAMMGSAIEVESAPGKGTTMSFTLALAVAEAAQPPASAPAVADDRPPADPTSGRRPAPSIEAAEREGSLVLVVDDHPINRMVLLRQVQALGYAAEAAQDGIEALEMWGTGRFALVLTDCHMPELDGYDLTRHVRDTEKRNRHPRTPIVACTANVLGGEAERCLAVGMDDYLLKPVVLRELALKLDQWLPLAARPGVAGDPGSAGAAPGCAEAAVLDRDRLALIVGADEGVRREALGKFRAFNREDVGDYVRAVEQGDAAAATHYAHRIKGAARTFGADALACLAAELEAAGRAADVETLRARVPELREVLGRLDRAVDAVQAETGGACPAAVGRQG